MSTTTYQYPGLGLSIRHWPPLLSGSYSRNESPFYPLGSHPNVPGSASVLLPMREVAMMAIMDRLTDKPDWNRKVFDVDIVNKWKSESMAVPDSEWMSLARGPGCPDWDVKGWGIMSEEAFDFCIKELQSKARYYGKTALIPTLDASATVVKSDKLVPESLREALKQAFKRLKDDQAGNPDWHPRSGDMVQDLVHPSMFPLIFGKSKVLKEEVVGVADAVEKWAGKGETIQKRHAQPARNRGSYLGRVSFGSYDVPKSFWSDSYQWLPSNVAFRDDGSVRFTSYINNLHPTKYPEIYEAVEKLIETAIPAWDHILLAYQQFRNCGPGRKGSRFAIPNDADDEVCENWNPSDPAEVAVAEVVFSQEEDDEYEGDYDGEDEETRQLALNDRKWKKIRKPVFREPTPYEEVDYDPYMTPEGTSKDDGGLFRKFKAAGLQVIVKMASIELTPEKPEFPAGGWHVEGLLNEKICATALYYLDSENISESSLAFRMQTSYEQDELQHQVGQDSYSWLEHNYGASLGASGSAAGNCIQSYGSVETREGRLLAFPNVFQHRVSPFKLADPTKPGYRRFIALWLVDPHPGRRILSTANVPPQQQDWWAESVFGKSADSREAAAEKLPAEVRQLLKEKGVVLGSTSIATDEAEKVAPEGVKLPPELLEMVRGEFSLDTLSLEEAKEHRLALMDERTTHQREAESEWSRADYSFCEH